MLHDKLVSIFTLFHFSQSYKACPFITSFASSVKITLTTFIKLLLIRFQKKPFQAGLYGYNNYCKPPFKL